ncbi:MAG: tetratricopeptide repeat protein, partial [Deltaproteobacteria bacterium]
APVPGPSNHALDTRLLRFRTRPGSEPAAARAAELLDADRPADALDIVSGALVDRPGDTDLRVLEGRAHLAGGDLLRAQASLLEAAKSGHRKEPFRWLGEVLIRRGDGARALKVLERARSIDPSDRAIALLAEQAGRLARGEPTSPVAAPTPPSREPTARHDEAPPEVQADEPTVVRSDLMQQLAQAAEAANASDELEEEITSVAQVPTLPRARTPTAPPASDTGHDDEAVATQIARLAEAAPAPEISSVATLPRAPSSPGALPAPSLAAPSPSVAPEGADTISAVPFPEGPLTSAPPFS